jgi:hypothetical protein
VSHSPPLGARGRIDPTKPTASRRLWCGKCEVRDAADHVVDPDRPRHGNTPLVGRHSPDPCTCQPAARGHCRSRLGRPQVSIGAAPRNGSPITTSVLRAAAHWPSMRCSAQCAAGLARLQTSRFMAPATIDRRCGGKPVFPESAGKTFL